MACIGLYKASLTCADKPQSLCCTRADKEVFANVWSLRRKDNSDALLTQLVGERAALVSGGSWVERCSPIAAPTAFCIDGREVDGRDGPFMVYNSSSVSDPRGSSWGALPVRALFRCITGAEQHFFSTDASCEGVGTLESTLGWMATTPGLEMLRALRRCSGPGGVRFHALDLACDSPDPTKLGILGFVR